MEKKLVGLYIGWLDFSLLIDLEIVSWPQRAAPQPSQIVGLVDYSTQLNSSLLTKGSRMAKGNTVHKNKSNDQSEWDKKTIKRTIKNSSITVSFRQPCTIIPQYTICHLFSVISVPDVDTAVSSTSFIGRMERRLASLYSFAMSSSSSSAQRKRATTVHNATVQVSISASFHFAKFQLAEFQLLVGSGSGISLRVRDMVMDRDGVRTKDWNSVNWKGTQYITWQECDLTVCLSVRPSHAGTVCKRLKLRSWGLHWRIAPWL